MSWDVMGGVARRAWARNEPAIEVSAQFNDKRIGEHITLPYIADEKFLTQLIEK
jgi:urocanate hydratase